MPNDGILLVHKEKGLTSFDLVNRIKKGLKLDKIGHTGTLDPNAEGLMVVLFNKATKANQFMVQESKEYVASLRLGLKTDTKDIWGTVLEEAKATLPDPAQIKTVFDALTGRSEQIVPMVSAVRVNGKRLHEYHREGLTVQQPTRSIDIFELELLKIDEDIHFRAVVGSGTFIRTLCEDIAERLGTIGTMASLIRTKVGTFELKDAVKLDQILQGQYQLMPLRMGLPYKQVQAPCVEDIKDGKLLMLPCEDQRLCVMDGETVLAVYQWNQEKNAYACVRGLW